MGCSEAAHVLLEPEASSYLSSLVTASHLFIDLNGGDDLLRGAWLLVVRTATQWNLFARKEEDWKNLPCAKNGRSNNRQYPCYIICQ